MSYYKVPLPLKYSGGTKVFNSFTVLLTRDNPYNNKNRLDSWTT